MNACQVMSWRDDFKKALNYVEFILFFCAELQNSFEIGYKSVFKKTPTTLVHINPNKTKSKELINYLQKSSK